MIFAESHSGVADGANHPPIEIGAALHVIQNRACLRIHQQAIDGEVAA
jgi:hypothetical protein